MLGYRALAVMLTAGALLVVIAMPSTGNPSATPGPARPEVALPSPMLSGVVPLEEALLARRSIRELSGEALPLAQVGQLLWAAQGITDDRGHRTAPSAGATYPLELLVVTAEGVSRYLPDVHALRPVRSGDIRGQLAQAAAGQAFVGEAPLTVVVAAVVARTAARYGPRAERYVAMEAGHAAQNLLLQAVALGLASVPVGAFDDVAVARLAGLSADEVPLYLLPVGRSASDDR
jgi:SagB-type dehydrogenase family enzyme